MFTRRHLIASTAAAIAAPAVLRAQSATLPAMTDFAGAPAPAPQRQAAAAQPEPVIDLPPTVQDGYQIPPQYQAVVVPTRGLAANQIHIVPQEYHLYFTLPGNRAIRYGVAVGQEGLGWSGSATIKRKVEWPSWTPTPDMIERDPEHYEQYADGMPGGPENPLGARALYFYQGDRDTAIRVHGTTSPASIGKSASNGCFRMYNSHVIDLYNRVPIGARAFAY